MLVIAHRGANREALENSWQAFEKAIEFGCPRIELDLQMTADQEVVIMHDDETHHVTPVARQLSKLTMREVAQLRLRNGEAIPTLPEVLSRLLGHTELNLEIKGDRPELAHLAARQVSASPYSDRVIFSCFYPRPLMYLREKFPHLRRAVLWGHDTLAIQPASYLAPQLLMQQCGATIFHPQVSLLGERLMDQAHSRNWLVYPWVPMQGEENHHRCQLWQKLRTLGVHGLCTNYPREMQAWLALQTKAQP